MAIFIYSGNLAPAKMLDLAVSEYVERNGYYELMDASLENPWMRIVLSDINSLEQKIFKPNENKLAKPLVVNV